MPDERYRGHPLLQEPDDGGLYVFDNGVHGYSVLSDGRWAVRTSDTVFDTSNRRMWVDWTTGGVEPGWLLGVPAAIWLHPTRRQRVYVGWWKLGVQYQGQALTPWRTMSALRAEHMPWSVISPAGPLGSHVQVTTMGLCSEEEDVFCQWFRVSNLSDEPVSDIRLVVELSCVLRTMLIEEGSDAPAIEVSRTPDGVVFSSAEADTMARVTGLPIIEGDAAPRDPDDAGICSVLLGQTLSVEAGGTWTGRMELALSPLAGAPEVPATAASSARTFPEQPDSAARKAAPFLDSLEPLRVPDPLLAAGLRRAAVYARGLSLDMGEVSPLLSDHISFGADMPRDSFSCVTAVLPIWPELARSYLRFYYQRALRGEMLEHTFVPDLSDPDGPVPEEHSIDAVAYILLALARYWRLCGDDGLLHEPGFREGIELLLAAALRYRSSALGLIGSSHRSSDEACVFPYNIPGNALLAVALTETSALLDAVYGEPDAAASVLEMATGLRRAILTHGVVEDAEFGEMFAFEVSEDGDYLLYDQADIPNLTSLPFFGFCEPGTEVLRNTLAFVHSPRNIGYAPSSSGKFRTLSDGSKRFPANPWPLGRMSEMMSSPRDPAALAAGFRWLSDCLPPSLQLSETVERHTGRVFGRYWFAWPSGLMLTLFNECVCGIRAGDALVIDPVVPEGWDHFCSPIYTIRDRRVQVIHQAGRSDVIVDGVASPAPVEL